MRTSPVLLLLCMCACARGRDLPGEAVASDGAVDLSPPRLSTAPHEALGPIESALFPPEVIMEHQAAIGIQPAQRDAITKEVDKGQSQRLQLQWQLDAEKEKLVKVLVADRVDEAAATEAASHVMQSETLIKSAHLATLVRIKNLLTSEQQKQLRALR